MYNCIMKNKYDKEYAYNGFNPIGMKFNMLNCTSFAYEKISNNKHNSKVRYWNCICDCGNSVITHTQSLKQGIKKSCGCSSESRLTKAKTEKICEMWDDGYTIADISNIVHMSCTTIRKYIKENIGYDSKVDTRRPDRKLSKNHDAFMDMTNKDNNYWAGMLAADGSVNKYGIVSLELKHADISHITEFKNFMQSENKIIISDRKDKNSKTAKISFMNKQTCEYLKNNYNIVPNKTDTYVVPYDMIYNTDFWRGVIDGDGSIYLSPDKKKIRLNLVGSKNMIESFNEFIRSVDDKSIIKPCKRKREKSLYSITVNKQDIAFRILDMLYGSCSVRLDRKYKRYKNYRDKLYTKEKH